MEAGGREGVGRSGERGRKRGALMGSEEGSEEPRQSRASWVVPPYLTSLALQKPVVT